MKKYILCLLFCLALLASCVAGGGSSSNTLHFYNDIGESFEVKLMVKKYVPNGHGGQFTVEKTLQEIQTEILEKNDCKVSIYENTLLIEKTINEITQIVTISKYKDIYIFEQPHITLLEPDDDDSTKKALFFAPTFYIDTDRNSHTHDYHLVENQWYKINCLEEEYMNIYKRTNMFTILDSDFYTLNIKSSVTNRFDKQTSIQIEFKVENNLTYIKYSI
ncbi:MAG: hypothetical protein NC310_02885 [Roseburia sp.]|nr:hypothetical protein [Anaeroplasma bactoclasticum]MCM1196003.1 hypothetical protein [Roseburia sp.]MCM1556833.1 hypothetical protein [Anaeroplasma bactoclasticum]